MKFLVPNYSCLQNPWIGGYRPPDPRSLSPLSSTEFVEPPRKKFLGTPLPQVISFICKKKSEWRVLTDSFYKLRHARHFSLCRYNYRVREFEPNWGYECMSPLFSVLSCLDALRWTHPSSNDYRRSTNKSIKSKNGRPWPALTFITTQRWEMETWIVNLIWPLTF